MASATFYGGARDGDTRGSSGSFATARSTGALVYNLTATSIVVQVDKDATTHTIDRPWFAWDTSLLGAGAIVTAADLSFRCIAEGHAVITPAVGLVAGVMAGSTLVASDHGGAGATEIVDARASFASLPPDSYWTPVLNAAGRAAINVTGWTVFVMRLANDLDNAAPGTGENAYKTFVSQEGGGASAYRPTLNVTYTPGAMAQQMARRKSGLFAPARFAR